MDLLGGMSISGSWRGNHSLIPLYPGQDWHSKAPIMCCRRDDPMRKHISQEQTDTRHWISWNESSGKKIWFLNARHIPWLRRWNSRGNLSLRATWGNIIWFQFEIIPPFLHGGHIPPCLSAKNKPFPVPLFPRPLIFYEWRNINLFIYSFISLDCILTCHNISLLSRQWKRILRQSCQKLTGGLSCCVPSTPQAMYRHGIQTKCFSVF